MVATNLQSINRQCKSDDSSIPSQCKSNTIKNALLAATCVVLSSAGTVQSEETSKLTQEENGQTLNKSEKMLFQGFRWRDWKKEAAVLSYSEQGRVHVNQALIKLIKESDQRNLQIGMDIDSVSGPSENGAVSSANPQTFTSPSGNSEFIVEPGKLPYYQVESHQRQSISASIEEILNSKYSFALGARYSYEHNYISNSVTTGITRSLNKKNTLLSANLSAEKARVAPLGGVVRPGERKVIRNEFSSEEEFRQAWDNLREAREKIKRANDLLLGISQVINKNMVAQLNYSYGTVKGYQNDGLKLVSIIDELGEPVGHVYEGRPDRRSKQSIYWNSKISLSDRRILGLSYRYYWDDWGIRSHTLSSGIQFEINDNWKVEPQFRWYKQSEADFFTQSLFQENDNIPKFMSADYRLAESNNITLAVNVDYRINADKKLSFRFAHYVINTKDKEEFKRGRLKHTSLTPDIRAGVFMMSYEF